MSTPNPYLNATLATAPPQDLVVRCLRRAVRACESGATSLTNGEKTAAQPELRRARDILHMLIDAIDPRAGAIAADLERCYRFALERVTMADLCHDVVAANEAARVLTPIAEGFDAINIESINA